MIPQNQCAYDCEAYYRENAATIEEEVVSSRFLETAQNLIQRAFDIAIAIIGIIVGAPFVIFAGLLIKLEDGGPVFYRQERVGLKGRHFRIYKLRSMNVDAEANGPKWASTNDPRVTRVGSIIRKTRIDELPQLINVLCGHMSIIGPRPERPEFTVVFDREIPGFIHRLQIKPGITGWAQVNGGYDVSPMEKLELDLYYIENRSFILDLRILLKTIKVIMTGEGAR